MNTVLIVIQGLVVALFLFGLTFHDKLWGEQQQHKQKMAKPLIVIDGGKAKWRRRA